MGDHIHYTASAAFESARRTVPAGGLHGHSFLASVRAPAGTAGDAPWTPFPGGEIDELRTRLAAAVAPLDYQLLDDHVADPGDENLARWLAARLDLGGPIALGVQGTRWQGVWVDADGRSHAWRRYQFEAAHQLPRVPAGHKCGRMHGHGFALVLQGAGVAPAALDLAWEPLRRQLQHACLNEIAGLENPTSEIIARWIWTRLCDRLPSLSCVTVHETATCGARFDGARFRIWKDLGFDSAVRLAHAPADDPRRQVHGHSYRLRLHLAAALDTVMGWTIDFGDVKEIFAPVFARLDHHPLHELPGVAATGALGIVRWARAQAADVLPQLEQIDLEETAGCGIVLSWGEQAPALPA